MMSDTVSGPLSAKRSLIGVLLGSAKSIARFRLRQRHTQILEEGLNCSEFGAIAGLRAIAVAARLGLRSWSAETWAAFTPLDGQAKRNRMTALGP
jgi:hypothetical protein